MTAREQADTGMEELAREVAAELAWVAVKLHGKETLREITPLMTPLIRAALTRWADKARRAQMEADCAVVESALLNSWAIHDDWGRRAVESMRRAFGGEPPDEKREENRCPRCSGSETHGDYCAEHSPL